MAIYFRADTTRLTYRELWRITSGPRVFLTACVNKILGLRAPATWAIRHDDAIHVVQPDAVPEEPLRALEPVVEEFQASGARLAFYQFVPAVGKLEGYAAVLLVPEHNAIIVIAWARARISRRGQDRTDAVVTSQLKDGTFFSTTNRLSGFNKPPEFKALRLRGAAPAELMRRHQEALAESDSPAILIQNAEQAKTVLREIKRRNFELNVDRGVYVLLTAEERARLGLPVEDDFRRHNGDAVDIRT